MASSSPSPPASSSSRSRASGAPVHLALAPERACVFSHLRRRWVRIYVGASLVDRNGH
ncbi:hypothetical protein B296_00051711, partial [Ensete ventricosum]